MEYCYRMLCYSEVLFWNVGLDYINVGNVVMESNVDDWNVWGMLIYLECMLIFIWKIN